MRAERGEVTVAVVEDGEGGRVGGLGAAGEGGRVEGLGATGGGGGIVAGENVVPEVTVDRGWAMER